MTLQETKMLVEFIQTVCVNWKPQHNTAFAWQIIFEPYTYDECLSAAAACLRKRKYIPDPAEIIAEIPSAKEIEEKSCSWEKKGCWSDDLDEYYFAWLQNEIDLMHEQERRLNEVHDSRLPAVT